MLLVRTLVILFATGPLVSLVFRRVPSLSLAAFCFFSLGILWHFLSCRSLLLGTGVILSGFGERCVVCGVVWSDVASFLFVAEMFPPQASEAIPARLAILCFLWFFQSFP